MIDAFDLSIAEFHGSPDVSRWPISTAITSLAIGHNGIVAEFSKKNGPDRWPDFTPAGWDGPLQYTFWIVFARNGIHAAAALTFWHGRGDRGDDAGGDVLQPNQIGSNWLYSDRYGVLRYFQPAVGERIGFFVTPGSARFDPGVIVTSIERSNLVAIAWPASAQTFTFGADPVPVPVPLPTPPPAPVPFPIPAPVPPEPPVSLTPLLNRIAEAEQALQKQAARIAALETGDFVGRAPTFGGTVHSKFVK